MKLICQEAKLSAIRRLQPSADRRVNRRTLVKAGESGARYQAMKSRILWLMANLALAACTQGMSAESAGLPDGYAVISGDRGKTWLAEPDGSLVHGGLIKQLYKNDRYILLITYVPEIEGEVDGPRPLDNNCYVALLIASRERQIRQVRLAEAHRLASKMTLIESSQRS
jgi:hypothetical protein